jgi:CTP:molybdopterin cytidylyltransferase MocA
VGGVVGLVLAAGAGSRIGAPKALIRHPDGTPWGARTAQLLAAGGCAPVVVVVGAQADAVRHALRGVEVDVVQAAGWAEGMGTSLGAGLRHIGRTPGAAEAVLIALVDDPTLRADVVRRIAATATPEAVVRATYAGKPGHPVLVGRNRWGDLMAGATADRGGRDFLAAYGRGVECGDLAPGADVDTEAELPPGHTLP